MLITNRHETLLCGTYQDLAAEYYDPHRHPTCANFRQASSRLVEAWLHTLPISEGWLCEIGSGMSILAELLSTRDALLPRLLLVDSAPSMLQYSKRWSMSGAHLLLGSAFALPIASGSTQLLVSSLGDPYNATPFWKEACRILRPGGFFVFTTPSHDWASTFRAGKEIEVAEFELSEGRRVRVPSWIYSRDEQAGMFEQHGLVPKQLAEVPIAELQSERLSPKLLHLPGANASVVTGYLLVKRHE